MEVLFSLAKHLVSLSFSTLLDVDGSVRVTSLHCFFQLRVCYLLAVCTVYLPYVLSTCSVCRRGLSRTPTGCPSSIGRAMCVPLTLTSARLIAQYCAWTKG